MNEIVISGRPIVLKERSKSQLKGISVGDSLSYRFYDGEFHNIPLLFAEPKSAIVSPRIMAITADRLYTKFGLPVVFILPSCPAYERQRLIDKDVFFVVSDKYAHLPMLIANERIRKTMPARVLTPVAQYLLLFHLQIQSLEGMAALDIKDKVPYSYSNITLGISCLSDLGLCQKVADGHKRKVIHFNEHGSQLWEKAQPYLIDPIQQKVYCDDVFTDESFPICGINALAHYSNINRDQERIIMMSPNKLKELLSSGKLFHPNFLDGNIIIEAWKYPIISKPDTKSDYVDILSLIISLRNDSDPRIENEISLLINNFAWKA